MRVARAGEKGEERGDMRLGKRGDMRLGKRGDMRVARTGDYCGGVAEVRGN